MSVPTPSSVATPVSTGRSDAAQYACPRCTGKFGWPKIFPRKAELMRHITQKCEQTIEIQCSEANCFARLTRPDHFKEHLRKVHHLQADEIHAKAAVATPITLLQRAAIGCGFCRAVFVNNPERYGNHIAAHFRDGLAVETWSPTLQVLSLLYQTKEVWQAWMDVIGEQQPGVLDAEQHIKLNKETAASFVGMLEKGLDAETIRPGLKRLYFVGIIGERTLDGQIKAHSDLGYLQLLRPAHDASSLDSGYGASSGQTSLRAVERGFSDGLRTLEGTSTDLGMGAPPSFDRSTVQHSKSAAWPLDPNDTDFHQQTSCYDNGDNDVTMHDTHDVQTLPDNQPPYGHSTSQPTTVCRKSKSHRRSASEKLKGMWNEARRSLGLAGPYRALYQATSPSRPDRRIRSGGSNRLHSELLQDHEVG